MLSTIRFTGAFVVVLITYALYAFLVAPQIDGTIATSQSEPERVQPQSNDRYKQLITDVFPKDDWIHGRCKILDAKQSILFFKEARQMEDGNWEVKPFTMFLNPDQALVDANSPKAKQGAKTEKPIILRTSEGAYIKFEDGSSPNSPSGKFSGARMPGKVTVLREESAPDSGDRFEFTTTNIQVNKKQILAVNPVRFQYGKHYGSGHNLTINLASVNKRKKPQRQVPLVRNLKTIELAHLDEIVLQPDDLAAELTRRNQPRGIGHDRSATTASSGNLLDGAQRESPVRITCSGPFRLDFGKSKMVLFDQVHVEQLHQNQLHDHLYCDRMEVDFLVRQKSPAANRNSVKEKIRFHKVTAFGSPAKLLADSKDGYAQANRIEYFLKRQIVHCKNNVVLRDGAHQFTTPELRYQFTDNRQLGTGWATGPGKIIGNPDDPEKMFQATWETEFNIQPHEGKKAVSLHGNAHIVFQQDRHFECDEIHFWLFEKRLPGPKPKWDYHPAQLLGLNNVRMDAPQFAGNVKELRLFWPNPIGTLPNSKLTRSRQKKSGSPKGKVTSFASEQKSDEPPKAKSITRKPVETRLVASGQIAIGYLTHDHQLKSFKVEKEIHVQAFDVRKNRTTSGDGELLDVVGNEIQIVATPKKDAYRIDVVGTPAVIEGDGVKFEAPTLTVDQSINKAWSNVPGSVLVAPRNKNRETLFGQDPETLIKWNKSFEFDGWVLRLKDDITFNGIDYLKSGEQITFEGRTPHLAAGTNRYIDFLKSNSIGFSNQTAGSQANGQTSKPKIKIKEFALLEQAYVKATTRESIDTVKSIDEMMAAEINVRVDTGDSRALGPGNIRSIRRGGDKKTNDAERGLAGGFSGSDSELSYMEIAFAGRITGNIYDRKATVTDQVRCVYGPAENWDVRYDPDGNSIFAKEVYLNCDQLNFHQWRPIGSKRPMVELAAVGNTEMEGKKFRATASQLTYTEENEVVLLEGLQRTNAKIWFRSKENQPWHYGEAKRFRYQKETSELLGSENLQVMRSMLFDAPPKRRK